MSNSSSSSNLVVTSYIVVDVISSQTWPSNYFHEPNIPSISTYGFQNALNPVSSDDVSPYSSYGPTYPDGLYVFDDACTRASNGSWSCFDHCNTTENMFASLPNLHNCVMGMVFLNFTERVPTIRISDGPSHTGFDPNDSVKHVDNDTAVQIGQRLQGCLVEACHSRECDSLPDLTTVYGGFIDWFELNHDRWINQDLCVKVPSRVDPDIGGIGVYLSYWIQSTFAIVGLTGILIYKFILPYVHLLGRANISYIQPPDCRKVALKRLSRLITSLTDFHKTQCFFMMATNIASIVVSKRAGLHPQSLQQIYNSFIFLKMVAISGYLPVSFTLFILHMTRMTSWYLISLSCVSIIFSIATLGVLGVFSVGQQDYDSLQAQFRLDGYEKCGGVRPEVFCQQTIDQTPVDGGWSLLDLDYQAYSILGYCLVVMVTIVASKLGWTKYGRLQRCFQIVTRSTSRLRPSEAVISRANSHFKHLTSILQFKCMPLHKYLQQRIYQPLHSYLHHHISHPLTLTWHNHPNPPSWSIAATQARLLHQRAKLYTYPKLLFNTLKAITYFAFLYVYLSYFALYMRDLTWFATNKVYNNTWNFGQVVAISVWLPAVAEWVHLEFRGMRRGMEYKLLPPYRITSKLSLARSREDLEKDGGSEEVGLAEKGEGENEHDDDDDDREAESSISVSGDEAHSQSWTLPEPQLPSRGISLSNHERTIAVNDEVSDYC